MIALRPLTVADLGAAQRLSMAFDWPHRQNDWRAMLDIGAGVAAVDATGALRGTTLWWLNGPRAATIGMVLVDPILQRQGVGRRLMDHALSATGDRSIMLYATQAGLRLYEALGFRVAGRARQYRGEALRPVSSKRVRLALPTDGPRIHRMDTDAFGAPRRALIAHLLDTGTAVAIEANSTVSGFAVRRRFGRGQVIGPAVARSRNDAIELVAAILAPGFLRIDVADDDPEVETRLIELGFAPAGGAVRMTRGDWPATTGIRFALVSQAFG